MPEIGPFVLPALAALILAIIVYVTFAWVLPDKDDDVNLKAPRKQRPRKIRR